MNNLEEKKFKKAKNFGYTFSFFFLVISIYTSLNKLFLPYSPDLCYLLNNFIFSNNFIQTKRLWQRVVFFGKDIFTYYIVNNLSTTIIPINILWNS